MRNDHSSAREWGERILLALFFTAIAASIMLVFLPWGEEPELGRVPDYLAKIGVSGMLLGAALLARRSERLAKHW